ncbi:MAG: hypothetical protein V2I37_11960 [Marinilabiliaceae bacterium]|jgi:hypothetical protein|nr:hypothetical protein [Marinilabiliaceae bacterium]
MKKLLLVFAIAFAAVCAFGQDSQDMVAQCSLSSGDNTTAIKNFVIKLPGSASADDQPVHKANMYLMKNQTYRFTMCNADNSEGELVFTLYDNQKQIISSYVEKSGNIYSSVDFSCNKTGLYQLWYNFKDGKKGFGVGIVSIVR